MTEQATCDHDVFADLVGGFDLVDGFAALMEKAQELERNNKHLKRLLGGLDKDLPRDSQRPLPSENGVIPSIEEDELESCEDVGLCMKGSKQHLHFSEVDSHIGILIERGFIAWEELGGGRDLNDIARHKRWTSVQYANWTGFSTQPKFGPETMQTSQCPLPSLGHKTTTAGPSRTTSAQKDLASQNRLQPNGISKKSISANSDPAEAPSQPASSASKCPIRYLDQQSPEDIAEYFKNHQHEIPRSHEICVKRYQRNEDQIKQLDHKYGSLVNMIQGLGLKHQPMLHTKDEESMSQDQASQAKIQAWNQTIGQEQTKVKVEEDAGEDKSVEQRQGHFERPLKEIRVGESPSRPWGISVPQGAHIPPSAPGHHEQTGGDVSNQPEVPTPASAPLPGATVLPTRARNASHSNSSMLFTGPVFIGYPPDQIAQLLQQTDLGRRSS
ncbi:MAG: hypothetical protein Q9174_003451 [Haloplaca sp. 1 TL-2023]